jgi:hypothetical protein
MTYVMEMPVEGGGVMRVQLAEEDVPAGLRMAANDRTGQIVERTTQTVQSALDDVKPAITAATNRLRTLAADEVTVEFGLALGLEGGAIIAKGSAEVHFTVTLTWKHPEPGAGEQTKPAAQAEQQLTEGNGAKGEESRPDG